MTATDTADYNLRLALEAMKEAARHLERNAERIRGFIYDHESENTGQTLPDYYTLRSRLGFVLDIASRAHCPNASQLANCMVRVTEQIERMRDNE